MNFKSRDSLKSVIQIQKLKAKYLYTSSLKKLYAYNLSILYCYQLLMLLFGRISPGAIISHHLKT